MAVTYADGAITLDNPPANSYDIEFMYELAAALADAEADADQHVIVVQSTNPKFFSAGADVKRFLANDVETNMEMIRLAHETLASIARSPRLYVAWIAGHALGGGLEIALACDVRYGHEGRYRLGTPEVTLGLLPGNGGTQRLTRLIGIGPAMELLVTGRTVEPLEAERMGLISHVFASQATFDIHVAGLRKLPSLAISHIKRAVYEGIALPIADGLALEREMIERLFRSSDAREGLTAFAEKREPKFTGA